MYKDTPLRGTGTPLVYCRWTLENRGNPSHSIKIPPDNPRMNGCSTLTPLDWAMAPTAKGSTAAPPPPNAAAKPIELT